MTTTAYDLLVRTDLDRLETTAGLIAIEADPVSTSDLRDRIYDALVEALRHVEVSE